MRKIEREMCAAICNGRGFQSTNTRVVWDGNECRVYLHGHNIAHMQNGLWLFNLCGWNTPTTRSRINAIARDSGAHGVCTRKGVAYSNGRAVSDNEWF